MDDWRYDRRNPHDVVSIPLVWIAFALSLLVHLAALWFLLPMLRDRDVSAANADMQKTGNASLAVQLEPRPATPAMPQAAPSPPPSPEQRVTPPRRASPKPPAQQPRPSPPMIAAEKQPSTLTVPSAPAPAPQPETPAPAAKPLEQDLAAYIQARKRERGEMVASASQPNTADAPQAEDDVARRNRIVAANLGLNRTPNFGYDPKNAGGIFQIEHLTYEYADFYFFGLNKEIQRNTKQLIEVKRGNQSDIRVAVVRRMIEIIRDNVSGDFVWLSKRGPVTMSARVADNAELEAFILRDVFPDARPQ